jgi:hypothetical protein
LGGCDRPRFFSSEADWGSVYKKERLVRSQLEAECVVQRFQLLPVSRGRIEPGPGSLVDSLESAAISFLADVHEHQDSVIVA